MAEQTKECCPVFDPKKWDGHTFDWKDKPFIKDSLSTIFHMPLWPPSIGKKIMKMCKLAEEAGVAVENKSDILMLFYDPHSFKSEMYLSTTGEVPNADNVTISGKFRAKVFDGPYKAIPKFMKEMDNYLAEQNEKAQKYYMHYSYCPGCAKKFGHNYMILFAKVGN
jgi:hypothetical protein